MIGKYLLPILAVVGLAVAVGAVIEGNQTAPVAPPIIPPAKVTFSSYIAGAGIIEARPRTSRSVHRLWYRHRDQRQMG